jgi:hypothetical protein
MVDDELNENNHIDVDIRHEVEHLNFPNIRKIIIICRFCKMDKYLNKL